MDGEWFGWGMKFLTLISFLFCCSCSTRYQPDGFTGGYEELQLSENMFSVSFRGNGYTRKQKAIDFCLLRCAEISKINGYRYFTIVDQRNDTTNHTITSPSSSVTTGTVNSYGGINAYTTNYGGQSYNISKPTTSNTIICYNIKPNNGIVYDALFLLKSIGGKYGLLTTNPKNESAQSDQNLNAQERTNSYQKTKPSVKTTQDSEKREKLFQRYIDNEITREEYYRYIREISNR